MIEKILDNEFYVVVWEGEYGVLNHTFIHLRNGEILNNYMFRVYGVTSDKIEIIYKRSYVKQ
jgi:hypothetical protein